MTDGIDQTLLNAIADHVPDDALCAQEIGFEIAERYNASDILFGNLAAGRADKVAIYTAAGNTSYGELCARAAQCGNALASLGLRRGDRVLLLLNDTASYPAMFFGAVRAGFVPMLINTLSPKDLIGFYLQDSAAAVAVVDAEYAALFDQETVAGTQLHTLVMLGGEVAGEPPVKVLNGDQWFAQFPSELEAAPTSRGDMAFWMYSSGSTGRPKGIVHLQHDMAYTADSFGRHILGITERDICFSVPKIFFAYGFGNSITFPFSVGASTILLAGRPEPGAVLDLIERFKPTLFFGLPTLYNAMLHHPRIDTADLSSVRLSLSAAEVLSQDIFNDWKRRFDLEIVEGLGSTEVLHIYLSNTREQKKTGTAGKRVPGYEIRLTTPEGEPVAQGEEGVMWVRGHSNAPCYWNRPDKTAQTMREAGWIWTGDRLVEDADGFFTFVGRVDDLIKVSGQWIYPVEIELCLSDHPAVRECAVLGLELPDRRMTTKAFVILRDGHAASEGLTRELQDHVKSKLLPYKYPRLIEYRSDLPKTGTGKIDRQKLRSAPLVA
ncbi:benzoate-CoA ligase family protein [Bradyrhizobium sp. CCBAU 53340]|uniref:benzoate-CoA ligase family protein n=1 Tax=Bradyrhizobium sp. CCBAU 53340 TaxID=1325112 RepID=UPI00188CAC28|nr:benzoate-CoA ligase family protein [Bradyrhizobium sp. CCBAU 53340]QOZ47416.1 benzoate-CoA ligase family protein [Bradyrhizobium sp. CCBAU 53340]